MLSEHLCVLLDYSKATIGLESLTTNLWNTMNHWQLLILEYPSDVILTASKV